MPLDAAFYDKIEPLFAPGFGTENVGPLLYALARMTRPNRVLEVGLGYTTPFLVQALKDGMADAAADRETLQREGPDDQRRSVLLDEYFTTPYAPRHYAIDDYSAAGQTADRVLEVLRGLGTDALVELREGDFRGQSAAMDPSCFPLDLVWFDCGDTPEYVDFINEYWPLINPDHGMLLLHSTYWHVVMRQSGRHAMLLSTIANEIKRQQLALGREARFEVLSLLEPHKLRQGSVTMIRKLSPPSMCRDRDFRDEVERATGNRPKPIEPLQ